MKKSEIYKYAQVAVLACETFSPATKLEVLKELMHNEDVASFTEKQEEESR